MVHFLKSHILHTGSNLYNMDEMGCDQNKKRRQKVLSKKSASEGLKHVMDITDGDNNPFHVTNCFTTRADGATPIPPMLGHACPSAKKDAVINVTRRRVRLSSMPSISHLCHGLHWLSMCTRFLQVSIGHLHFRGRAEEEPQRYQPVRDADGLNDQRPIPSILQALC